MENYKKSSTSTFVNKFWFLSNLLVHILVVEVNNEIHSYKLDANTIHMNVKSGSKVSNLMNYAYRQFEVNLKLETCFFSSINFY